MIQNIPNFLDQALNQWKDVLTNTQINLIEKNLKSLMRYFNYI